MNRALFPKVTGALAAALLFATAEATAFEATPYQAQSEEGTTQLADPAANRRADAISNRLMSPFCPGRTLAGCPSPSAGAWREDIRQWVQEGASTGEIEKRLVARSPGFNLTGSPESEVLPVFGMLAAASAAGLLLFVLRRMVLRRSKDQPESAVSTTKTDETSAQSSALDNRLDEELKALD